MRDKPTIPQTSDEWKRASDHYQDALLVKAKKSSFKVHSELVQLDIFVHSLKDILSTRNPKHITKEELIKISKWKLLRGKFRPGFLKRIEEKNTPETVVQVTTEAFGKVNEEATLMDAVNAIGLLNTMYGISYATSSLLLSIAIPTVPFMTDELIAIVNPPFKKAKYDQAEFKKVYEYVANLRLTISGSAFQISDWIWAWNIKK
jgi:hypothetical protein